MFVYLLVVSSLQNATMFFVHANFEFYSMKSSHQHFTIYNLLLENVKNIAFKFPTFLENANRSVIKIIL